MHPGLNICEAVCEGGVSDSSDGFGGDVELGVVGIRVEMEAMVAYGMTKGKASRG